MYNIKNSTSVYSLCQENEFITKLIDIITAVKETEAKLIGKINKELKKYYKLNESWIASRFRFITSQTITECSGIIILQE